jgi:hypothetical protein
MAQQSSAIASASKSSTNALAMYTSSGSSAISTAGLGVNGAISSSANRALQGASNLASNMPGAVNTDALTDVSRKNIDQAGAGVNAAANGIGSGPAFTAGADAEIANNAVLQRLDAGGSNATNITNQTLAQLRTNGDTGSTISSNAASTGTDVSKSFYYSALSISSASDDMRAKLEGYLNSTGNTWKTSGGVMFLKLPISDVVRDKFSIDAASDEQVKAAVNADKTLTSAWLSVNQTAMALDQTMNGGKADLNDALADSKAFVDDFLAGISSTVSSTVSDRIASIQSLKSSAQIQISQLDGNQLDKIRGIAANMDSLMNQVSNFLNHNNPELFNQVQSLPSKGQQLFMRLQAMQNQAANIRQNAYDATSNIVSEEAVQDMFNQIYNFNSTAFDLLGKIGAKFNTSANSYSADLMNKLNAMASEFQDASNNMQTQLNAIAAGASTASKELQTTPGGDQVIAQMQAVHAQISALASSGNANIQAISSGNNFTRPANFSVIARNVSAYTASAGENSAFASTVMQGLSHQATISIQTANGTVKSQAVAQQSELDRQAQLASLNEGMANSMLASRQAAMKKLRDDTQRTVADYANQATIQSQVQMNSASYLYDSIKKSQAETMYALGRMAQKYAAGQSETASSADESTAATSATLAQLKQQVSRMMYLFDSYLNSEQAQFNQSEQDRSGFIVALLMEIKRKMASIDDALYKMDQGMVFEYNTIASKLANVDSSEIDSLIQSLEQRLNDWEDGEYTIIQNAQNQTNSLTINPFNLNSIQRSIQNTVNTAAATAVRFLNYYNIPVPASIQSLVTNTATAFQAAYAAQVAVDSATTTSAPSA